jgi:hypothetical protein
MEQLPLTNDVELLLHDSRLSELQPTTPPATYYPAATCQQLGVGG